MYKMRTIWEVLTATHYSLTIASQFVAHYRVQYRAQTTNAPKGSAQKRYSLLDAPHYWVLLTIGCSSLLFFLRLRERHKTEIKTRTKRECSCQYLASEPEPTRVTLIPAQVTHPAPLLTIRLLSALTIHSVFSHYSLSILSLLQMAPESVLSTSLAETASDPNISSMATMNMAPLQPLIVNPSATGNTPPLHTSPAYLPCIPPLYTSSAYLPCIPPLYTSPVYLPCIPPRRRSRNLQLTSQLVFARHPLAIHNGCLFRRRRH